MFTTPDPHQQTITFDRVFDIVRMAPDNNYKMHTVFSFTASGKNHYGAGVPGLPELSDGMTVTVFFDKPGDWITVIGWANHGSGEVVCDPQTWPFSLVCLVFLLPLWLPLLWESRFVPMRLLFLLLSVLVVALSMRGKRRLGAVRSALESIAGSVRQPPPGANLVTPGE